MRKLVLVLVSFFVFNAYASKKVEIPKPYLNPQVEQGQQAAITAKSSPLTRPGLCELEVANLSHKGAYVDVVYDNFTVSAANYVSPGYSLYIPLHYSGYCHSAAYTLIYSPEATVLYKDFGYVDQTLKIYSGLNSQISVEQIKKSD